jgi:ABC-type multidrug transport system fused ATPase/permease subunit
MNIILKLFTDLFHRFPLHFIFLFSFVFLQALLNAISVVAVAPITDFLLNQSGEKSSKITQYFEQLLYSFGWELSIMSVFIVFCMIIFISGIASVISQYALLRIKYDVLIHLLSDIIGQFFRSRFLFFSQSDMGVLLNSFQKEVNKVGDNFGQIAEFFSNLLQACIFLIVPFTLSPKLTIIFLISAGIISSPLWMLRRLSYRLGEKDTETSNIATGVLHESLSAAKLIISFGCQRNTILRYNDSIVKHSAASVNFQTLQRGVALLFSPLGIIATMLVLYIAYLDKIPFSDMAMVMFALMRLIPLIGLLVKGKASIEGFIPAYEQIEQLRELSKTQEEPNNGIKFIDLKEGVFFKNVTFRYPDRKPALKKVNLSFPKRRVTALVGKSGSGKTTVVDLMMGLYENETGDILLDGIKLDDFDLNSFRTRVGYVTQEPQLFNLSIRDNLLWSLPDASEDELWRACRMANAEEFVLELPEQMETLLGDRGVRLSGGQRQRLALARAIIRKPVLLILDEATSALDTESETLIQEALDNLTGEMTIVVIAHRLSTIYNADYVYVLDRGNVVEEGTYSQLANMKGRFSDMLGDQILT